LLLHVSMLTGDAVIEAPFTWYDVPYEYIVAA
jgi:hypothetical protein